MFLRQFQAFLVKGHEFSTWALPLELYPLALTPLSLARVSQAVGGVAKTRAPTFSGASKAA